MKSPDAIQALLVLLPMGYLVSAALHGSAFGGLRAPRIASWRTWSLRLVLVLHLAYFVFSSAVLDSFPVVDLWSTLSATGFFTALSYAGIARSIRHPGTGGVVLGVVAALQTLASALGHIPTIPAASPTNIVGIVHVSTIVIAVSAVVLSGVHGVLYLVLYRQMRERRFGPLFEHLPDLTLLAQMTRRSALIGFLAMTIGLNVGIGMAHALDVDGFHYADPGVLMTILLWLHFGVIAFSRFIAGVNAQKASWAAAAGLVALLFTVALTLLPNFTFHTQG